MSYIILPTCKGCTACVKVCPVNAISGERNQVHTIHASTCIECGACAKICPYQTVLDAAGQVHPFLKRALWPKPSVNEKKCISCGMCLQDCPTGVMEFAPQTDYQVKSVARLGDPKSCIACSFCQIICPVEAIIMEAPLSNP